MNKYILFFSGFFCKCFHLDDGNEYVLTNSLEIILTITFGIVIIHKVA